MSENHTLISLQLNYANFVEKYNKNLKKAMFVFNVIDDLFICSRFEYITLGVYLKLFRMFEYAVKQIDLLVSWPYYNIRLRMKNLHREIKMCA